MWDVGNEVILTMQDHGLAGRRGRGPAGGVRQVRQRGRAGDPRRRPRTTRSPRPTRTPRPGRTTSSTPRRWTCSRSTPTARSTPSSGTGSPAATPSRTSLTEGGPDGEWEVPNDVNGVPDRADRPAEAAGLHGQLERDQGSPGRGARRDRVPLRPGERLRRRLAQHHHRRLAAARLPRAAAGLHRAGRGEHPAGDHRDDGRQPDRRAGRRHLHRERRPRPTRRAT